MISIEEARSYYKGNDASHDFDHVLRVWALAERIGAAEGADMEVLRAAVLLHDVARARQDQTGLEHAAAGAAQARKILSAHPPHRVEAVARAIATHRFREQTPPDTLEAKILYDADKLDAIGAIGVARAFMYGARHGQRLWSDGADSASYSPSQEFAVKLVRLKETLFTATARAIAEERHAFMVAFFERLEAEVRGEL
jgi:uncharacterized protein